MVKILNINVFHEKVSRVSTFRIWNTPVFPKKSVGGILIFYGESKNWDTRFVTIGMQGFVGTM